MYAVDGEQIILIGNETEPGLLVVTGQVPVFVEPDAALGLVTLDEAGLLFAKEVTAQLVVSGDQGPRGPQGVPGDSTAPEENYVAGEAVTAYRAAFVDTDGKVYQADKDSTFESGAVIGLFKASAAPASPVAVHVFGSIDNPAWTWTSGEPVFLGTNGQLTQTAPTSGSIVPIGVAVTATRLHVRVDDQVIIQ